MSTDEIMKEKIELTNSLSRKLLEFLDSILPEEHSFGRINVAVNVLTFTTFNIISPSLKNKKDLQEFLDIFNNQYKKAFKELSKKRREKNQ